MAATFGVPFLGTAVYAAQKAPFRLHLFSEPVHFDAYRQKNSNAGYLLSQTHWSYLKFKAGELKPALAEACDWKGPLKVECKLRENLKYSNGQPILPGDWLRPLKLMLDPKNPAPKADLLFPIKNARKILEGKSDFSTLGMKSEKNRIVFDLEYPYSDFLYHLTVAHLAPLAADTTPKNVAEIPTSGPYKIKEYQPANRTVLEPNLHFFDAKAATRPLVEYLFVSEDAVALSLYKTGKLDFNRRLATMNLPEFQKSAEYHEIPLLRFDYIGLRPFLDLEQRRKLAESLDYEALGKMFFAKPRPGCLGIPAEWYGGKNFCHDFKTKAPLGAAASSPFPKSKILFSRLGGDDHRRAMEWVQSEWMGHLGYLVDLQQMENNLFLEELKKKGPVLFRKGVSLDRPSCLAAIEVFHSESVENFFQWQPAEMDRWIEELRRSSNRSDQQNICKEAVSYLMKNFWIIPTGPIYFAVLAKPQWTGWNLNQLNELDLSELRLK